MFDSNNNTVSGMSIQFGGGGPWSQPVLTATNNTLKLLAGGIENSGSNITISNIPYSAYDVYVYVSGWDNTRAGYLEINHNAAGYTSGARQSDSRHSKTPVKTA